MKKQKYIGLVIVIISITIIFIAFVNFNNSYITTNKNTENCIKISGAPEEVASNILKGSDGCRITGKGLFKNTEFINIICNTNNNSFNKYVFGSKEACDNFKNLNSVEYIKLHLRTMLAPNKALKRDK